MNRSLSISLAEDTAVLLRSWRSTAEDLSSAAARRRVARHPDGLGHLAAPEDRTSQSVQKE